MAKTRVGVKASAEARAAMSAAHRGLRHSEQAKAKIGEANHKRLATTDHDSDPRVPDDVLDQDMRPDDLVFALEHLSFRANGLSTLQLDRPVREYIVDALRAATAR